MSGILYPTVDGTCPAGHPLFNVDGRRTCMVCGTTHGSVGRPGVSFVPAPSQAAPAAQQFTHGQVSPGRNAWWNVHENRWVPFGGGEVTQAIPAVQAPPPPPPAARTAPAAPAAEPAQPEHHGIDLSGVGQAVSGKVFGLPVWGWLALVVVAFFAFRNVDFSAMTTRLPGAAARGAATSGIPAGWQPGMLTIDYVLGGERVAKETAVEFMVLDNGMLRVRIDDREFEDQLPAVVVNYGGRSVAEILLGVEDQAAGAGAAPQARTLGGLFRTSDGVFQVRWGSSWKDLAYTKAFDIPLEHESWLLGQLKAGWMVQVILWLFLGAYVMAFFDNLVNLTGINWRGVAGLVLFPISLVLPGIWAWVLAGTACWLNARSREEAEKGQLFMIGAIVALLLLFVWPQVKKSLPPEALQFLNTIFYAASATRPLAWLFIVGFTIYAGVQKSIDASNLAACNVFLAIYMAIFGRMPFAEDTLVEVGRPIVSLGTNIVFNGYALLFYVLLISSLVLLLKEQWIFGENRWYKIGREALTVFGNAFLLAVAYGISHLTRMAGVTVIPPIWIYLGLNGLVGVFFFWLMLVQEKSLAKSNFLPIIQAIGGNFSFLFFTDFVMFTATSVIMLMFMVPATRVWFG